MAAFDEVCDCDHETRAGYCVCMNRVHQSAGPCTDCTRGIHKLMPKEKKMPATPTLKSPDGNHSMTLLPPAADKCQTCATAHEPELPHNAQSIYYQMAFNMKNKRWPTWNDAMKHCTPAMRRTCA